MLGKIPLFKRQSEKHKRSEELRFWRERLASKGGLSYWRDLYVQLYCCYLNVARDSFANKVVADIGCGPHGALSLFEARVRFGIDPLANEYHRAFNLGSDPVIYLSCGAEQIPLLDGAVDVVISRNAIDHVDDFSATIGEIHRIMARGGEIHLAINYQEEPTVCEPNVIRDKDLREAFAGRFKYEITKRFPTGYDAEIGGVGQFKYPHEIVQVKGTKI